MALVCIETLLYEHLKLATSELSKNVGVKWHNKCCHNYDVLEKFLGEIGT